MSRYGSAHAAGSATPSVIGAVQNRGVKINIIVRCLSPDAVKSVVRQQTGIGILFCQLVEDEIARNDLKALKSSGLPKLVGHSYITYSKNKPLSYAANEFLQILRSMRDRLDRATKPTPGNEHRQRIA